MKTKLILLVSFITLNFTAYSQQPDPWQKWSWLIGEWVGEGSGKPGQGSGEFSFRPDLNNQVLIRKSHSEYPATDGNPAVIHDDLMIVYPDAAGGNPKAVYFDNEGHVIYYSVSYYPRSIVFTSQKIPNAPFFRLTYAEINGDAVDVAFEISSDGKVFTPYLEGKSVRKK